MRGRLCTIKGPGHCEHTTERTWPPQRLLCANPSPWSWTCRCSAPLRPAFLRSLPPHAPPSAPRMPASCTRASATSQRGQTPSCAVRRPPHCLRSWPRRSRAARGRTSMTRGWTWQATTTRRRGGSRKREGGWGVPGHLRARRHLPAAGARVCGWLRRAVRWRVAFRNGGTLVHRGVHQCAQPEQVCCAHWSSPPAA